MTNPYEPPAPSDRTATAVLMLLFTLLALFLAFMGVFLVMGSDGCSGSDNAGCETAVNASAAVATLGPLAALAGAFFVLAARIRRNLTTWWIPVAGAAISLLTWLIGFVVGGQAVG